MIGRIRGVLLEKKAPWLLIELNNGLAFQLEAPMSTFYHLPEPGEEVILLTHQVIREEAQLLYGFYGESERQLFRTLIKVNGVGPKLALTILSSFEPVDLVACVNQGDTQALVRVPGIGQKTADRLMVELRNRLEGLALASSDQSNPSFAPVQSIEQEAQSALVALGYKVQEAARLIAGIDHQGKSTEEIIKEALQGIMA